VRHAWVCMTVAGLVLSKDSRWLTLTFGCADISGLHACKTLVGIMKDVKESLDDVRDDLHGVQAKAEGAVEATTLGIKPSQA